MLPIWIVDLEYRRIAKVAEPQKPKPSWILPEGDLDWGLPNNDAANSSSQQPACRDQGDTDPLYLACGCRKRPRWSASFRTSSARARKTVSRLQRRLGGSEQALIGLGASGVRTVAQGADYCRCYGPGASARAIETGCKLIKIALQCRGKVPEAIAG